VVKFAPRGTLVPRYGTHADVAGLPAQAIVITNSERTSAHCSLRWYFGHGLGLRGESTERMEFGSAGHEVLEDIYRWWMERDALYESTWLASCAWCSVAGADPRCERCRGSGLGPVERVAARWRAMVGVAASSESVSPEGREDVETRIVRLRRIVEDYLHVYGLGPFVDTRIVGVEATLAMPIYSPGTTRPYAPEVPIAPDGRGGTRFARPGDGPAPAPGARLYGRTDNSFPRLMLHAASLQFKLPDGSNLNLIADPPPEFNF